MPSRLILLSCTFLSCSVLARPALSQAADLSPSVTFGKARALYYTPVDNGLQGFHCEVTFDWKDFIQRATNQAIPESDARLKYLQTIQLSIDDDLRGRGELHWAAPTTAPEASADSVGKIRDGMQQMWSGFFQSWNGFYTGDLVSLDAKATVERTAEGGFRVAVRTGPSLAEELYDNKLLLKSVHVATPTLESTIMPAFATTPKGLIVSAIGSSYKQPPTAQPTDVQMTLTYAPVGAFQIPSALAVSVGPAKFDYHLNNCTVRTELTQK